MSRHAESQILALEDRLRQAMLTSDVAELDALIAPELLFTSHLGHLVSKSQDLAMHQSGVLQLQALTPSDRHIQRNDGFTVVSVQMHLLGHYNDRPVDEHIRYTRVWAMSSSGQLQIVAGHASVVAV
jgi:hypothetical protein